MRWEKGGLVHFSGHPAQFRADDRWGAVRTQTVGYRRPAPFTHSHTCTLADNYPTGPRRQDANKARAPNSFRQGPRHSQGLSLGHIRMSFFLDICLFSFALMNMISGSVSRLVRHICGMLLGSLFG